MLTPDQAQRMARATKWQPYVLGVGCLLVISGATYSIWATQDHVRGTQSLDRGRTAAQHLSQALDRPVTQVVLSSTERSHEKIMGRLRELKLQSSTERNLVLLLATQLDQEELWIAFLVRIFFGQFIVGLGGILVSSALTQWSLLKGVHFPK